MKILIFWDIFDLFLTFPWPLLRYTNPGEYDYLWVYWFLIVNIREFGWANKLCLYRYRLIVPHYLRLTRLDIARFYFWVIRTVGKKETLPSAVILVNNDLTRFALIVRWLPLNIKHLSFNTSWRYYYQFIWIHDIVIS